MMPWAWLQTAATDRRARMKGHSASEYEQRWKKELRLGTYGHGQAELDHQAEQHVLVRGKALVCPQLWEQGYVQPRLVLEPAPLLLGFFVFVRGVGVQLSSDMGVETATQPHPLWDRGLPFGKALESLDSIELLPTQAG